MATREGRIFGALRKDADAIVILNAVEPSIDLSFFYATGIKSGLFEGCAAIVWKDGVEVVVSELEGTSARQAGVRTTIFKSQKERDELMKKKLRGLARIGINSEAVTHASYRLIRKWSSGSKLVDVSKAIADARMIKDRQEIEAIKGAARIASRTADEIPDLVGEGQRETEAAAEINYCMMKLGAAEPSFSTNASFGVATAEPHYVPGSKRLKRGQLALFDFGASYARYVSDVTRTYVCGRPSKRQKEMYEVVLEAQLAAIDAIEDGAKGKNVDAAARAVIDRSKFKGRFIHGTGHGLGLSVHDPGLMSPHRKLVLREGMVMTVEPGVYVKGFGGVRIEDDILVTRKGCRVLTDAPKEFLSL